MSDNSLLILDFGGGNARSLARRLRANGYYCEVQLHTVSAAVIEKKAPSGLIFAGNCQEVAINEALLALPIPKLALGSSARRLLAILGAKRKSIRLANRASQISFSDIPLFDGITESSRYFDRIDDFELPEEIRAIAEVEDGVCAGFYADARQLYGLQFYPEVNDPDGTQILINFAGHICRCTASWTPDTYVKNETEFLRGRIGDARCIAAVTGSTESIVCAVLLKQVFQDRVRFLTVDTGCLRKQEAERIRKEYLDVLNIEVDVLDKRDAVLEQLAVAGSSREKRSIVENAVRDAIASACASDPGVKTVVFATTYSNLLEYPDQLSTLGGHFGDVECLFPLRMLFQAEVRDVALSMNIPDQFLDRQPFPMAGLAAYCVGKVTEGKLLMLREAEEILRTEMQGSGYQKKHLNYFPILTNMKTPSSDPGRPALEYACILHISQGGIDENTSTAARLPYDLLARLVEQITHQVPGINRVLYDITNDAGDVFEPDEA